MKTEARQWRWSGYFPDVCLGRRAQGRSRIWGASASGWGGQFLSLPAEAASQTWISRRKMKIEEMMWFLFALQENLCRTLCPHTLQYKESHKSFSLSLSLPPPLNDGLCQHLLQSLNVHSDGTNVLRFGPGGPPTLQTPLRQRICHKAAYWSLSCHLIRVNLVERVRQLLHWKLSHQFKDRRWTQAVSVGPSMNFFCLMTSRIYKLDAIHLNSCCSSRMWCLDTAL